MKNLIILFFLSLFLTSCSNNYTWGWHVINPFLDEGSSNISFLISGLYVTILISLFSIFFSIILGFIFAIPGISSNKYLILINLIYVEIIRSIPLLVLLLWVYYGLPIIFGLSLSPFVAGIVSLALSDSAFEAEIFRGGIESVHKGQNEASKYLGLNYWQSMRLIFLPQALITSTC